MKDPDLLDAAVAERDHRLESYNRRIAAGGLDPAKIEAMCLDYQCWVAIAAWLETDRFDGFYGGADPESPSAPYVRWPELEAAAKKALDSVELKLAREGWFDGCEPTAISERRCALVRIHRKVALRRESIDAINEEFRAQRVRGTGEHGTPEGVSERRRGRHVEIAA
jgi:hypothetical protein